MITTYEVKRKMSQPITARQPMEKKDMYKTSGIFANVAKLVRERRQEIGVSQEALSAMLGYRNGQFISNIERGICSLPDKKINLLSRSLQLEVAPIIDAVVQDKRLSVIKTVTTIGQDIAYRS